MATKKKTTDVATTSIDDPADYSTDGPPIQTPDVADIKPIKNEDSHILLTGESWVELGEAEGVPDWAVGQTAAVVNAPIAHKMDGDVFLYDYTPEDALITVRERSQGMLLTVPLDSCTKVGISGGRSAISNFP